MEFNTLSVWCIIICLVLVTIFIVIWYGYKEIVYCKRKIEDMICGREEKHSHCDEDEHEDNFFEEEPEDNGLYEDDLENEFNEEDQETDEIEEFTNAFFEEPIITSHPLVNIEECEADDEHENQVADESEVLETKPKRKVRKSKKIVIEEL